MLEAAAAAAAAALHQLAKGQLLPPSFPPYLEPARVKKNPPSSSSFFSWLQSQGCSKQALRNNFLLPLSLSSLLPVNFISRPRYLTISMLRLLWQQLQNKNNFLSCRKYPRIGPCARCSAWTVDIPAVALSQAKWSRFTSVLTLETAVENSSNDESFFPFGTV